MAEFAVAAGIVAVCGAGKPSSQSTSRQEQSLIYPAGAATGNQIGTILQKRYIESELILQFSYGGLSENESEKFQSSLRDDSGFRQIALALQNDLETQSRTPDGAQTAGPRAKRLEMALRRNPARSARGSPRKQGAGSERQLKGQQSREVQKTPGLMASQERQTPSPRGHGKAE